MDLGSWITSSWGLYFMYVIRNKNEKNNKHLLISFSIGCKINASKRRPSASEHILARRIDLQCLSFTRFVESKIRCRIFFFPFRFYWDTRLSIYLPQIKSRGWSTESGVDDAANQCDRSNSESYDSFDLSSLHCVFSLNVLLPTQQQNTSH
jgi:hypothetical protein